ncbi:MAG: ABC transporter permease [Cyclobacteriaceae bacterium]
MFKNFIVLAYRHFIRSPLSSFIELFGMTAGLTVFLLVLLWVFHETSYDNFNEKADRIYRLERTSNVSRNTAASKTIVASLLKEKLPEVEKAIRFRTMGNGNSQISTTDNIGTRNYFNAGRTIYVDNDFFQTFSFEFLTGNPKTALAEKHSIVLTESFAKTVFGSNDVLGKEILDGRKQRQTVTGVIKDVDNFHIPFKMLTSFSTLIDHSNYKINGGINSWYSRAGAIYILATSNHDKIKLEQNIDQVIQAHAPEELKEFTFSSDQKTHLTPLKDLYLNADMRQINMAVQGDKKKIIAYTSIAFFTLLLACINFINLNNAKYFERIKEIGIKKVCGASRVTVFIQFFGETVLLCVVSLILALIFSHSLLPHFNQLIDSSISISRLFNLWPLIFMSLGLIAISLVSGGIPAMYLSSFKPVRAIKGLSIGRSKGFSAKKINLIVQFAITIILLIGSITAFRQVTYMKNADLGIEATHLLKFPFNNQVYGDKSDLLKQRLLSIPNVHKVSYVGFMSVPGESRNAGGGYASDFQLDDMQHRLTRLDCDEDYLQTLGLKLLHGRFFEKGRLNDRESDSLNTQNVVLNVSAVKTIGLENPIGVSLKERNGKNYRIIGVVKDFHLNSVNTPIHPTMLLFNDRLFSMVAKISSNDIAYTIGHVEAEVEKITGWKADVKVIGDLYTQHYSDDDNFASLIGYFTGLAILIACLGLLGVATHAIKLRIKEIGVRKIVGASSLQILNLLTLPFIKTILISALLAIPVGWIAMQSWLDNYPYRTDLPWWVFAVACGLTVAVAAFTIIWQSWRASSVNPARLIRYE